MFDHEPFNRSKMMMKGSLTQKKPTSGKLGLVVNGDGVDVDLTKASLFASAKPQTNKKLQPLKTPTAGLTLSRNNTFSSRTLSVQPNRTPMPSIRTKAAAEMVTGENDIANQVKQGQDISDDPLQRMVDLKKQYTVSKSSTRMRARNTSAHFESALSQKLKEVIETDVYNTNTTTGQILKSQRFKQNWHKKSHMAVASGIRATSQPRGSSTIISQCDSKYDVGSLPEIANTQKLAAQINVAELDTDSQFCNQDYQQSNVMLVNQAEQGSVFSQMGGGLDPYNTSYYHQDLMEEKGGEIARIMQKQRQQRAKASMANSARLHDTLGSTSKRFDSVSGTQQLELPQILNVRERFNMKKEGSIREDDDSDNTLKSDANQNNSARKSNKEARNNMKGTIDLETMKRARGKLSSKAKPPVSPRRAKQAKEVNSLLKAKSQMVGIISPKRNYNNHRDVISSTLDSSKVDNEMKQMTDMFAVQKGLGDALIDEMSIVQESDTTSVHKSLNKHVSALSVASTVKFSMKKSEIASPLKMIKMKSEIGPVLTRIKMRSPIKHKSFKLNKAVNNSIMEKSERSISTPSDSNLESQYELVEGLLDKDTALRVQKALKKKKIQTEKGSENDFIQKALKCKDTHAKIAVGDGIPHSNKVDNESEERDFNSELDLYSEADTVKSPSSPRRRQALSKAQSLLMRAIPQADDSAEERESESAESKEGDKEEGSNAEDEDYGVLDEEDDYERKIAMNQEQEVRKKKMMALAAAKKEDEQLCGSRLVRKIDDFVFQVSVEAGLPLSETMPAQINGDQLFDDTGNSSMFRLEETKNTLQKQNQKTIDKYFDEFRGQQAFYQLCKKAQDSKWTDPNIHDPRMQYYAACTKNNSVAKSILSKIIDKALVLRDLKLNYGDSEGLRDNFMLDSDLVQKLYLDQNGLEDNQLAIILKGVSYQRQMVNLTIEGNSNTVDEGAIEQIATILKRKVPDHLQELHLIHIKTMWQATEDLMKQIRTRNYLRKLSLIEVGLNDFSIVHLCEVVRTQKTLQALDISWNKLTSSQMRPLLAILQKNRRLTSLNLAWNNIMEMKGAGDDNPDGCSDQETRDIISMLGKIIKHSRTLQHMNLSGTGLSAQVIYEMGTILRRARAILSLHLSANPGLSQDNMSYLHKRIKCRPNEDIERFTRIQAVVKNLLRAAGASSNIISGINKKVERDTEFSQVHKNDPIEYSINDQLVFQRMLGHKVDIPGSGQWYESSKNAVACKPHYKNECWICENHSYCILFWSKGMCYKMNPILPADKSEEIRYEIEYGYGEQDDSDLMYESTNVKYSQLQDQVPFVCGSFTGWRYRKMLSLEEFNEGLDMREDPFELAHLQNQIRKHITRQEYCNEREQKYVELAAINEKLRLMYNWRSFFDKNLRYKRPILFNSHFFNEKPGFDGALPDVSDDDEDLDLERTEEISDDESEEQKAASEEQPQKPILTRAQQEELRIAEETLKRNPLPIVPDVTKFDKIFILPVFCKPGPHHYMVKYKDSTERKQARLLKEIEKQEKRLQAGKAMPNLPQEKPFDKHAYKEAKSALKPDCFFYHLQVPKRSEEIAAFVKPAQSKVVQREFNRDASVFKAFRFDTPAILKQTSEEDIRHWKGYRFIKSEEDRADTEEVLKKYFSQLKTVFLHLASSSMWPNIGTLDFCEFAGRSKIIDNAVNISAVDRCFIGATLKVENSLAPCNGLRRFEFLEILVRLANIKYIESKVVNTYKEATEKIITECVVAHFTPDPWQEFREQQLWTMDVNDLFEANLPNLNRIFGHYKTPTKAYMEIQDCVQMCITDASLGISEKDINFCYGYSHMTVPNEARLWKKYQSLELVEFLEFLGRLAHVRFKNSSPEMASQPLVQKIEFILDDLMQGFGMQRFDVNIDVLEFSESDDDY